MSDKQDRDEEKGMPILIIKDSMNKVMWARVVPAKGVQSYAVNKLVRDMKLFGHRKFCVQVGQ